LGRSAQAVGGSRLFLPPVIRQHPATELGLLKEAVIGQGEVYPTGVRTERAARGNTSTPPRRLQSVVICGAVVPTVQVSLSAGGTRESASGAAEAGRAAPESSGDRSASPKPSGGDGPAPERLSVGNRFPSRRGPKGQPLSWARQTGLSSGPASGPTCKSLLAIFHYFTVPRLCPLLILISFLCQSCRHWRAQPRAAEACSAGHA
jgi:hypothetical protein